MRRTTNYTTPATSPASTRSLPALPGEQRIGLTNTSVGSRLDELANEFMLELVNKTGCKMAAIRMSRVCVAGTGR